MPFPRSSGLLLHPTSLPGRFGIGDLGPEAYRFVDLLAQAGQRLWQVLPLGPTGYGDSPYQALSAFAGNPLLVSLEQLVDAGWLRADDVDDTPASAEGAVDYAAVIAHRQALWPRLLERFEREARADDRARFVAFCRDEAEWLDDYALYFAVKQAHGLAAWTAWPPGLAQRDPATLAAWTTTLARDIHVVKLAQFVFFEQWRKLHAYCRSLSIEIVGDLPIFVALDSADVWARRELFRLDERGVPNVVTGVPPDYFSATGQLWGNPHYDWARLADTGYEWWVKRVRAMLAMVDRIRLDHFRGFVGAWEVPGDAATAMIGEWRPGPGAALFDAILSALDRPSLPFIAENLGVITPPVEALRERYGLPGMAILQFAFGTDPQAPDFRPHNYQRNLVVYTGTHDNDTTVGWWTADIGHSTRSTTDVLEEREYAERYLQMKDGRVHDAFIRAALASVADTAIVPVQDILGLGSEARMNQPGVPGGNWRWRLRPGQLTADSLASLAEMTRTYERGAGAGRP